MKNELNIPADSFIVGGSGTLDWRKGPDLFIQQYGHPRLRQRHFPFKVDQQVRDQWVLCMHKALYEIAMPDELRKNIKQAIDDLATHMINAE